MSDSIKKDALISFKHWVVFTAFGEGAPIAYKLHQEGKDVVLAMVDDLESVDSGEGGEERVRRQNMYKNMLPRISAEECLKELKDVKNKDEYFIFFDLNCLWRYSEECLKYGFKYGNFFLEEDNLLEQDRDRAKEIVRKYYPDIEVAPVHEFKKVPDAVSFLEEDADNLYVLKSNGESGKTVVPNTEDVELAKANILEALEQDPKAYEQRGFILELKIPAPMEFTPQAVFCDGELIFIDIDIENKPIGSGNIGYQVGAAQTFVAQVEKKSMLAKIAFPPIVWKMAKKHTGIFTIDCSILVDRRNGFMYFGEYCTRFGYDSLFVEIAMSRSASGFFEDIVNGINPLVRDYGVGIRLFNLPPKAPYLYEGDDLKGKEIRFKTDAMLWLYDSMKEMEDGEITTTGYSMDTAVATGYGKTLEQAVSAAYDECEMFGMKDAYFRPESDFMGGYKTCLLERWGHVKHMTCDTIGFGESPSQAID